MKRVVALILTLTIGLLPAFSRVEARSFEAIERCCCADESTGSCPLCSEMRLVTGSCPCTPAQPRPVSSTSDLDRSSLAASRTAVVKTRRAADPRASRRLAVEGWIVASLRRAPVSNDGLKLGLAEAPPLRAALCIWTT